jgi:anti-anti-sigma factor
MATGQGGVRVHRQDQTVTFRVEGRATMTQSLPMRRYAERSLAEGARNLRIDLRECIYMDSTFLGTLLTLQSTVGKREGCTLTLLSPSPACGKLLYQMGLNTVFRTEPCDEGAITSWSELPAEGDVNAFKRNVAQAHEELANLPGPAGEQFRAVARCLAAADAAKPPPPPPRSPEDNK